MNKSTLIAHLMIGSLAALGAIPAPLTAQSGVILGTGEEILHLLDNSGGIAVDFNVDDLNTPQSVEFGRADLSGTDESDVDIVLIDSNSTLSVSDRSIHLDASAADIILGSGSVTQPGSAGTLTIRDTTGFLKTQIDGDTGNIVQIVDNVGASATDFDSNGAVKAWAIINGDGTVARCWNCNTSLASTRRISTGVYEVDFLSLTFGDLDKRPVLASLACATPFFPGLPDSQCLLFQGSIQVSPRLGDASSYRVRTHKTDGSLVDSSFTIVVF